MKFEQFQKIIQKIQSEIHCPQCKKPISPGNEVDILSSGYNDIFLCVRCAHCHSYITISAQLKISILENENKMILNQAGGSQKKLSKEDINMITQAIKSFRGKDVNELFGQ